MRAFLVSLLLLTPLAAPTTSLAGDARPPDAAASGKALPDDPWQRAMQAGNGAMRGHDLVAASELYQEALEVAASFPEGDLRTIQGVEQLASVMGRRGLPREAITLYERALALRAKSSQRDSPSTANALSAQAAIRQKLGELEPAEALLRRAIGLREQDAFLAQLASVVGEARPEDPEALALLERRVAIGPSFAAYSDLAEHHAARGAHEEAIAAYEDALALGHRKGAGNGWQEVSTLIAMAEQYVAAGRPDAAESTYFEALEAQQERLGPEHPRVADTLRRLGQLYLTQKRFVEAEQQLERAMTLGQRAWGGCHECTREVAELLSEARSALGRAEDACLPAAGAAKPATARPELTPREREILDLEESAAAARERGEMEKGVQDLRRALSLAQQAPAGSLETPNRLEKLGVALREQGRRREALEVFEQSLRLRDQIPGADPRSRVALLHALGDEATILGDTGKAQAYYREELDLRRAASENLRAAGLLETLGRVSRQQADEQRAGESYFEAADLWEQVAGPESPEVTRARAALASSYLELGRVQDAESLLADLLERQEQRGEQDPDTLLLILEPLERLYERTDRPEEASRVEARMAALRAK